MEEQRYARETEHRASLEQIRKLQSDVESMRSYMTRLENELEGSKEIIRSGRDERQVLVLLVSKLNEKIDRLSCSNQKLDYENELSGARATTNMIDDLQLRTIHAETNLDAAKMQATKWRERYDEVIDKLEEAEKRQKELVESHNESTSFLRTKFEEANQQTLSVQNELTTCKMRFLVLEREKADLTTRMKELSRSGTQFVEKMDSEEIEKLKKENEESTNDKLKLQRDLKEARERIEEMEKDLSETKYEVVGLESKCGILERGINEMDKLREEVDTLSKEKSVRDIEEAQKRCEEVLRD